MAYSRITTANVESAQRQVELAMGSIDVAQNNSTLLEDISVTAGYENKIQHGMGHTPSGWRVSKADSFVMVYSSALSSSELTLVPSSTCKISVEVY